MISENIKKARILFYKKEYNAALKLFNLDNALYEEGLCYLLLGDIKNAYKCWVKIKKSDPAANFALGILNCIKLDTKKIDEKSFTFFQTRAQLEIYLNLFLQNNYIEWAQNIISCNEIFYKANPESYKFIARALFANGYFSLAITFCKKSLDIFFLDPEAMFILSQCYLLLGDIKEADLIVNKIRNYFEDYYPARLLSEIIQEKINEKM